MSQGLLDINGKPLGTDFASFYAAGSLALGGRAASAYDIAIHYARELQLFGTHAPYYAWFYPPFFMLLAAPLVVFPYLFALAIWQLVTFALYFAAMRAILLTGPLSRSQTVLGLLATAAFPAVFINLGHGQNGFLTAALLGGALVALPRRPVLAGLLFGLLAYKPQFGLVIPVAPARSRPMAKHRRGSDDSGSLDLGNGRDIRAGYLDSFRGINRTLPQDAAAGWRRGV